MLRLIAAKLNLAAVLAGLEPVFFIWKRIRHF